MDHKPVPPTEFERSAEFDTRYRVVTHPVMMRAERSVLGGDYGASSFTTMEQADLLADALRLGPEQLLLDVGSGAGWPGLYLSSTTGCAVLLSDLSTEGPLVARRRIDQDGLPAHVFTSSGVALPLRDETVDAITCSDVFC